ncbi:MAG: hypothetical protein ACT4TC_06175, partial [Myxococcaceae bacterium]
VFENPKQTMTLPLDLVHYVVESTFGLRGFLKRLTEGEPPTHARVARTDDELQVEALVEALQGDAWGNSTSDEEFQDVLALACSARGTPGLEITTESLGAGRRELARLMDRWRLLAEGQTLFLFLNLDGEKQSAHRRASP